MCDPCKESYTLVRKLHTNWMQSYSLYSVFWPPLFLFPNQISQFGVSMLTFPVSNEGSGSFSMFTIIFYYSMRTLLLVLLFFILFLYSSWLYIFPVVYISCCCQHRSWMFTSLDSFWAASSALKCSILAKWPQKQWPSWSYFNQRLYCSLMLLCFDYLITMGLPV